MHNRVSHSILTALGVITILILLMVFRPSGLLGRSLAEKV